MMPKQALAGVYTTPIHARALTLGNRFFDRDGNEQVVVSTQQSWLGWRYLGDTVNGVWFEANETVQLVVGGCGNGSIC